ncbi:hypothetical protein PV361_08625, partial [Peptoniphilus grossensis]
ADTTAITKALEVTAQYTQNPSIVANPVQKYDETTDNQYIEGVGIPLIKMGYDQQMTDFGKVKTQLETFNEMVQLNRM